MKNKMKNDKNDLGISVPIRTKEGTTKSGQWMGHKGIFYHSSFSFYATTISILLSETWQYIVLRIFGVRTNPSNCVDRYSPISSEYCYNLLNRGE